MPFREDVVYIWNYRSSVSRQAQVGSKTGIAILLCLHVWIYACSHLGVDRMEYFVIFQSILTKMGTCLTFDILSNCFRMIIFARYFFFLNVAFPNFELHNRTPPKKSHGGTSFIPVFVGPAGLDHP